MPADQRCSLHEHNASLIPTQDPFTDLARPLFLVDVWVHVKSKLCVPRLLHDLNQLAHKNTTRQAQRNTNTHHAEVQTGSMPLVVWDVAYVWEAVPVLMCAPT